MTTTFVSILLLAIALHPKLGPEDSSLVFGCCCYGTFMQGRLEFTTELEFPRHKVPADSKLLPAIASCTEPYSCLVYPLMSNSCLADRLQKDVYTYMTPIR